MPQEFSCPFEKVALLTMLSQKNISRRRKGLLLQNALIRYVYQMCCKTIDADAIRTVPVCNRQTYKQICSLKPGGHNGCKKEEVGAVSAHANNCIHDNFPTVDVLLFLECPSLGIDPIVVNVRSEVVDTRTKYPATTQKSLALEQ